MRLSSAKSRSAFFSEGPDPLSEIFSLLRLRDGLTLVPVRNFGRRLPTVDDCRLGVCEDERGPVRQFARYSQSFLFQQFERDDPVYEAPTLRFLR